MIRVLRTIANFFNNLADAFEDVYNDIRSLLEII